MAGYWEHESLRELEEVIRQELRRVTLVGELELEPGSPLYEMSLSAVELSLSGNTANRFELLSSRCPAALSVLLVADGIFGYDGGEYWPNIALDATGPNEATRLGQQFEKSLDALGLERFESAQRGERALRYVMPILLHGKFPRYCAGDLWKLLVHGLRRGAGSVDELLSYWVRNPSALIHVGKPVQRFLRYGGELAEDLLQRMVDLIELVSELGRSEAIKLGGEFLAEEAGINTYLVDAFFELGAEAANVRGGERAPRPRLTISPYTGEGPSVFLPPVGQRPEGRWTIQGRYTQRQPTSRHVQREVPLRRSSEWKVLLEVDGMERTHFFQGHSDLNVFFFNFQTGDLIRDQNRVGGDEILALAPKETRFFAEDRYEDLPELEELPPLSGDWSLFRLWRLDLRQIRFLTVHLVDPSSELGEVRVSVKSAATRPRVVTPVVADVVELDGRTVYASPPVIALACNENERQSWRLRLRTDDSDERRTLDEMTWYNDQIGLAELLPSGRLVAAELVVRGPLGSDLRVQFIVVPELEFDHPDKLLLPGEEIVAEARAPGMWLNGHSGVTELSFESGVDSMELEVVDPVSDLRQMLLASVSRVLWMVRGEAESFQSFGGESVSVSLEEVESGAVSDLSVQLRRREEICLHLVGEDKVLQSSDVFVAAGPEGRWTFPLRGFYSTAAESGLARLELHLDAGSYRQKVGSLAAAYVASSVVVDSDVDTADDSVVCEVTWKEERPFKDREIRLWSMHRLWEQPIRSAVGDSSECRHLFEFEAPAGPYLVEVGIADDWVMSPRPDPEDNSVADAQLGRLMDAATHLRHLDSSEPIVALELVLAGKVHKVNLDEVSFSPVFSYLCEAIGVLTQSQDQFVITSEVFPVLMEIGFKDLGDFVSWLPSQGELSMSPTALRRFIVTILPELLLCSDIAMDGSLDRVWEASVVAGAAIDPPTAEASSSSDRWYRYTGWDPSSNEPLETVGPPDAMLAELPQDRLLQLATVLRLDQVKPLRHGGFQEAAFELLAESWPERTALRKWRSVHSGRDDARIRTSEVIVGLLNSLESEVTTPSWCGYFQDLVSCALHLTGQMETRSWATRALWEAESLSPNLVDWALLSAIVLRSENYATT